jgi:hypothetical protein
MVLEQSTNGSLPAIRQYSIDGRSPLCSPTDALVHVFLNYGDLSREATLSDFRKLHLGAEEWNLSVIHYQDILKSLDRKGDFKAGKTKAVVYQTALKTLKGPKDQRVWGSQPVVTE